MDLGPINLEHTLSCGQAFRWRKVGEGWEGVVDGEKVRLWQKRRNIETETELSNARLESYFRADDDYESILKEMSRERYVATLVRRFHGLRLLRQDPWECSASYILATFSNIPRIKGMIERICMSYGQEIEPGLHSFPEPKAIAVNGDAAETCGLGFRCRRFVEFSKRVDEGEVDFEALREAGYQEAHRSLVQLEGIGDKVADCIAVFSLDHLEAFPIDVRIGRTIREWYAVSGSYRKVSAFAREHFGPYAGYAQEFIYYATDRKNMNQD
ncbi:MAG TPA: DNA glycosylase [Methanomassiliicoccales archaeon]|nr:DNA glycosylase [Methanomassiliicoccales archaeon]